MRRRRRRGRRRGVGRRDERREQRGHDQDRLPVGLRGRLRLVLRADDLGRERGADKYAGAKPAGEKPSDGVTGAKIAGKDVEIVGYGCADDTADKAIEETRRLMEQEDADVMIGPLSGDEGIAVANYAKEHPDKT